MHILSPETDNCPSEWRSTSNYLDNRMYGSLTCTWVLDFPCRSQRGPQQDCTVIMSSLQITKESVFGFHLLLLFFFLFFFSLANGRDWTYLQHLRLLDSPLSYLLLSKFKGSLVGCKGLLIMLKIKVENNQVLKRTLHLKLQLSVVSINKDFCICNTDICIRNTGISIWTADIFYLNNNHRYPYFN